MLNLPNTITLLRFALIPAIVLQLLQFDYASAFILFMLSALSDFADGVIARRWNLRTRFGAVADPLADKLTMITVTLLLAVQQVLPWWFALAVVVRDALIVGGAIAYHVCIGHVEMAPSRISKLNTSLEFLLLTSVLALSAGHVGDGVWLQALMFVTLVSIGLSGLHYVLVWGHKAVRERGSHASPG